MHDCTVEPFGVILGGPERRHPTQAAVYDRVPAGEVNDGGGKHLSALRHHRCGVVPRIVRTPGHAVDPLQHAAHVAHLQPETRERGKMTCRGFTVFLQNPTHTYLYLSGNTQRLESIGSTGHDLGLVHQQDPDVVLTFNLQRNQRKALKDAQQLQAEVAG